MVRGRTINSPRLKDKKRKERRILWVVIPLIILSFGYLFTRFLAMSFLQIDTVAVRGTTTINPQVIQNEVSKFIEGNYLYLIPRSNTFLYPESAIIADIQKNFPIIKDIAVTHEGRTTLRIDLTEHNPSALWCEGEFIYHTFGETPCYYLTEEGYLYARALPGDDRTYVRYYGMSTSTPALGTQLFTPTRFHQFDQFSQGIIRMKLPVLGISVGNTGDHELYVLTSVATSTEYATIYFNERVPLSKTLENLSQFVANKKDSLLRQATTTLEYIDVRYGNTIFSKMK